MIRQSFKLIWNQRRKHLGLSFEIFFSFLVLFAVFSFSINTLSKYLSPLGYEYENVWNINFDRKGADQETSIALDKLIAQNLTNYPEIDDFAYCNRNVPFSGSSNITSIERENASVRSQVHWASDDYAKTMGMEIVEGRWFTENDESMGSVPVVINQDMAEIFFPDGSPIGQYLGYFEEGENKIVGVVKNFRYRGGIREPAHALFIRKKADKILSNILLKVNKKANATFEAKLLKELHQIAPGWSIEIEYLKEKRADYLLVSFIPILVLGIIGAFLIFNVALGLFGVLWQNIRRRRPEIGVRRAMGSSKAEITLQFVLETMVLATMSLIVGIFFAIQFPLLDVLEVKTGIYLLSIVFAIISIYLLVFVCALIPSVQAAELHPAIALREE